MQSRVYAPAGNEIPAPHASRSFNARGRSRPLRFSDPLRALSHPVWWLALGLLIVNDHVLKGAGLLDPMVTGKLSDLAGLIVAPMLMASILRAHRQSTLLFCHLAVGIVFAAINLSPAIASLWSGAFASFGVPCRVWSDPSDLAALPALAVSWRLLVPAAARTEHLRPTAITWIRRLALATGALACIASSPWPVARPTVVDGRVLVEDQRGIMVVVDATSGAVLKTLRASGSNEAPPAIHDRILYQVQTGARITGIHIDNPQTPFEIWKHPDAEARLRILAVDAHRLYVASNDERLRAIDRVHGTEVWSLAAETRYVDELTIEGDTIIVAGGERVEAANVRTGRSLWSFQAEDNVGVARVLDGTVYVVSLEGVVHGLSLSSGREVWRYDADDDACNMYGPHVFVQPGTVFACFDETAQAIDLESGKVRWSHERVPVGLGDDVLLLRGDSETLYGLDANSGKQLWRRELDDSMWTIPTVAHGVAYVRNHVGKLYAVDLKTGAVRWTLDMDKLGEVVAVGTSTVIVSSR